jgi:hypothetical protein
MSDSLFSLLHNLSEQQVDDIEKNDEERVMMITFERVETGEIQNSQFVHSSLIDSIHPCR